MSFPLPEKLDTVQGHARRLGVELEFAGLPLEDISRLVANLYGGKVHRKSRFVQTVSDTRWGDFQIEIDTALLKDRAYAPYLEAVGFNLQEQVQRDRVEDLLARIAATVVPHEIVTPPIPMREIHELETLREQLQQAKARGTRASVLYAFGLHLNPELPDLGSEVILAHLRAFLLLWDWLHVRGEIDWTRRLTPYVNEFPNPYRRLVVDPDYAPDSARLLADYLLHNPTRNRALDLLPVLRELHGDAALQGVVDAALVKARPAFHYRLPNCRIDEPAWTLAQEWQGWVSVEWLAARPDHMRDMGIAWLQRTQPAIASIDRLWAEESERWLKCDHA